MLLALVLPALAADRYATVHLGVGLPDLLGGSVSLTALRPFELEVGAADGILYATVWARAGAALPLHDGRVDGRGLLIEGLALGGYRYLDQAAWTGDFAKNGLEADLAAEASWWLAPHFALDAQLLAGGGAWIASNADGSSAFFYDGRLAIGVAF
jgi:hypothetical protein